MYKYRFLLFAVAAALPAAAVANDAALQCTLLQDNALRLACYDKVFAAQLPPEQPLSEHETDGKPQLDVVQSVRQSIGNKEATLVFDTPEGQAEPSPEASPAHRAMRGEFLFMCSEDVFLFDCLNGGVYRPNAVEAV